MSLLRLRGGLVAAGACRVLAAVAVAAATLSCGAWAATYHGKVVDAETGEPLEGAVIAVIWYKKPVYAMDGPIYFHNAKEAVTDAEGKFSLEARAGINWNPLTFVQDPEIIIYHPGYGPVTPWLPREFRDLYGIADALKRGAVIRLRRLRTKEELRESLGSFVGPDVPYSPVANLIRAVNVQRKMVGLQPYPESEQKEKIP